MTNKIIAVDFDGTIVEDKYPQIGKPMPFAFETLKKLQEKGYRLILWTYRHGDKLKEAVTFCEENGLEFYAINCSFEGEVIDLNTQSPKISADLFIDDRNLGGFPGWGEVYQIIKHKIEFGLTDAGELINYSRRKKKKKGFFSFLKK